MGKKKRAAAAIATAELPVETIPVPVRTDALDRIWPIAFPVLTFLACTAISRPMAIVFAVLCLLFTIGRSPATRLRERITPLTLAVLLYGLLSLIGGLRSDFGATAIQESIKTSIALSIFLIVLMRTKKDGVHGLFSVLACCSAIFGFVSIDGSSTGLLTRGFSALMGLLHTTYDGSTMGYETGVRVTGIFSNGNVSGGVLAFGCLIALYLVRTAKTQRKRILAFFLLGINALAFFLSFSMGAMGAFALACLLYLLTERKADRFSLFLLMLESIVATVLFAFIAYRFLGTSGAASIVPMLCALLCGPLVLLLDSFAGAKLTEKLTGHGKAVTVTIAALCGIVALYLILALNLTTGYTLTAGQTLSRAVYPAAGTYTLNAEGDDVQAVIYTQNESDLMMHTQTTLYEGPLSAASFTVPEDSRIVWFDLSADNGATLSSLSLSDGTRVKLGYPLLPGFASNRLQGLRANQNFIQRLVFFKDGITLWKGSPLTGYGLAAVEGRLTSVQSFYYESKYIHNQFIQIMDEGGLIGLASFVFLLGSALVTLLRHRKEERAPEFALLAACLTMMTAHSLTEVVWSTGVYQSLIFLLFAAMIVQYGKPIAKLSGAVFSKVLTAAALAVTVFFGATYAGNLLAADKYSKLNPNTISQEDFLHTMASCIRMDAYDDETYKVNYIGNALTNGSAQYRAKADGYAMQLRKAKEYTACSDVAQCYDLPLNQMKRAFEDSRAAIAQERSNKDAWNYQIEDYRSFFSQYLTEDNAVAYCTGVQATADDLRQSNDGRMQQIELTDENQAFLDEIQTLTDGDYSKAELADRLNDYLAAQ